MKKKFIQLISVILILALSASLAACGGGGNNNSSPGANASGSSSSPNASSGSSPSAGGDSSPNASGGGSQSTDNGGGQASNGGSNLNLDEYVVRKIGGGGSATYIAGMLGESYISTDALFDVIFRPDPVTKEIFSWVLTDWYYEDDVTFIMKMRDDIYFNNGAQAKSNDLLYSYTSYEDRGAATFNNMGIIWEECKTLDDYTVQFKFERAYPPFIYTQVNLINEEWSREVGWDSLDWHFPVGSGPYYVAEWVQDDHFTYKLRDDYWNTDVGPYYVDEWQIISMPDATTQFMEMEVGTIDMCTVQASDYSRFVRQGGDGYNILLGSAGTTIFFNFGMLDEKPLWDDIRMRQAIAYAVDWEKLGQTVYTDRYIPAYSIATTGCPDYINPGKYEYNPEKSKELLAECGYGPGHPLVLETTLMETDKMAAEAFQFYMMQIGVEVILNFLDAGTVNTVWRSLGGTAFAFWYAHRGSAFHELRASIPYAAFFYHSFNYIDDDEFLELYDIMTHTTDPAEYSRVNKAIQQMTFDKVLMIPYAELTYTLGYRTDKFTEEGLKNCVVSATLIQLSRLGLASMWE